MYLENQTILYIVYQNHILLYFLLIKIIAINNGTVYANITNIDTNGVVLNYTASFPLFELYYPLNNSENVTKIDGIPVYLVNVQGVTLYVDEYNHLVLSYVKQGLNFTINGSTIPLSPSTILSVKIPHFGQEKQGPDYGVYVFTLILVISFYVLYRKLGGRE